jgi:DNA topoisomerase-1
MLLGLGLDHEEEEGGEEEQQVYKWWLEEEKEGGVKWESLEHQGPLFPPSYEAHGIKMKYDGIFLSSPSLSLTLFS